jgi:N-acetyl-gamma-glutamyl-phosphate/LysW-gamma-L-alpha-aminoadipyl-6-phosphate reductase
VTERRRVAILGASGYTGGELLRILLDHPYVDVTQVTSEHNAGKFVYFVHPNLRGRTRLKFSRAEDLQPADVLFACLPHGAAQQQIDHLAGFGQALIDLSADFRLSSQTDYAKWYEQPHQAPQWLDRFVYGLPELHRPQLAGARYVSGVGCNATATILALWPLFQAGLADPGRDVIVEVKVGSSEGGAAAGPASHHPERSGAVRSFAPTGHRHTAEVQQALAALGPVPPLHLTVTAVELVRGVLATAHVFLRDRTLTEKDIWAAYRAAYQHEPFVRIVKERLGIYRYPEPKILAGSNYADVGFELDPATGRVVALCAIDNLMKGAAGSAVQCLNVMYGWDETSGLAFSGLHPI